MKHLLIYIAVVFSCFAGAQNLTELGRYDFEAQRGTFVSDIWGYVDENNNEYAIVGCVYGTSVVDVTDPANPVEVYWEAGTASVWRDIKVYNDYAYVTTEAEDGLLIIDLNPLPISNSLPTYYYNGPVGNTWSTAHNIFIDENGFAYIFGSDRGDGGVIILDLNQNPMAPVEVGVFDDYYCHDGFVRNDTAYFAHIYDGFFTIVDVSDKANPVELGSQTTPTQFAHQIWVDSAGIVFVLDEISGGYIASYDISNLNNIQLLDKIQCSPGNLITPHNGFTIGDFIVSSYYSYGVAIHDKSKPDNMVEVGHFDTNPHNSITTDGCWGVYPYLPSGNILATDIEEGLFILAPNYVHASFLEGNVTNQANSQPIPNVDVDIVGVTQLDLTEINGDYAAGVASDGSYDVIYSKLGWYPDTFQVNLISGQTTIQDVQLVEIPRFPVYVKVTDQTNGNAIYNANILFDYEILEERNATDGLGESITNLIYPGNYTVEVGKWGYEMYCETLTLDTLNDTLYIELNPGYEDDFSFDLGWSTYGNAERGDWERVIPNMMTQDSVLIFFPNYGAPDGCNNYCYTTDNGIPFQDVKGGNVVLVSPVMDLTSYADPHINYFTWFFNAWGSSQPDDSLWIYLSDGNGVHLIDFNSDEINNGFWKQSSIRVKDFVNPSSTMQLIVETRDTGFFENYTEAGFDNFSVTDFYLGIEEKVEVEKINFYPNPSTDFIQFQNLKEELYVLSVFDMSGKMVKYEMINSQNQQVRIDGLEEGLYLLNLMNKYGSMVYSGKLIKL
ncbi:MAG: choice-of-anchor B family protein [Crocinitomicaceae bacterium]|nr:choice-of-anchor B family protein [Crocinitomicaceae bacterium]